jgi:catechol 2,3-dioxygenase-like lactoylglutathione lyase family enzyme
MAWTPQALPTRHLVLVLDCADLDRAADFWTAALGYVRQGPPGGPYQGLVPGEGGGIELLLQRVPQRKVQKNRLHLDIRTRDLESEVRRVLGLGATFVTSEVMSQLG